MRGYNKKTAEFWRELRNSKNSLNEWIEFPAIKKLLPSNLKDKMILDIGCGTGETSMYLAKKGALVTGIEPSAAMLGACPKHENITYYNVCAEDMEFKKNSFDMAISQLSLDYIKNLDKVLAKIHSALKKDGKFVVSLTHPFRKAFKKKSAMDLKSTRFIGYFNEGTRTSDWGGNKIMYYNRTLQAYFNSFVKNRFNVNRIVEPLPLPGFKKISREAYEYNSKIPFAIIFEMKKA